MKNSISKLALAALISITAVTANAAMTTSASGDSSLILTLLNTSQLEVSATFDLGFSLKSFDNTVFHSWDLTTGDYAAAWNSIRVWDNGKTQVLVFAGDNTGSVEGSLSLFKTAYGDTVNALRTEDLRTSLASFDRYIQANNALVQHINYSNSASFVYSSDGDAYAGSSYAYGRPKYYIPEPPYVAAYSDNGLNGLVGTNLNVWTLSSGANSFSNTAVIKLSVNGFNPYFNLSTDGILVYAVPEADTSAMLLMGAGVMGFIARRRKHVAA